MKITRADLAQAAAESGLNPEQVDRLWAGLGRATAGQSRFVPVHVVYYAGALLVIGAMGWFMTAAWESLGGASLALIATGYAAAFVLGGRLLWDRLALPVPGGLLFTMAVGMVPLATYGLLRQWALWPQGDPGAYHGFHVWVQGSWVTLELATVLAGIVALRLRRFPFLTAPIAVALWYLSMDLTPLLTGAVGFSWEDRRWVSLWFGLAMLVGAYVIDWRQRGPDFAFWIYLFGLAAFWGGLSLLDSDSEAGKAGYALINLGLIVVSLVLRRTVFLVFGAMGVTGYIGHLAYRIFADSMLFPVALSMLGLALIALGVIFQRNRTQVERTLRALLPAGLRAWVPARAWD